MLFIDLAPDAAPAMRAEQTTRRAMIEEFTVVTRTVAHIGVAWVVSHGQSTRGSP